VGNLQVRRVTLAHERARAGVRHGIRLRRRRDGGDGLARPRGPPQRRPFIIIHSLFVLAELSYITYHAGLTHFLFAHIIAEGCDALVLVTIALGLRQRVAPLVPGALQHR